MHASVHQWPQRDSIILALLVAYLFLTLSAWSLVIFKLAKPGTRGSEAEDVGRGWNTEALVGCVKEPKLYPETSEVPQRFSGTGMTWQTQNLFCKHPGSKYFSLYKPHSLCCSHTVLWQ